MTFTSIFRVGHGVMNSGRVGRHSYPLIFGSNRPDRSWELPFLGSIGPTLFAGSSRRFGMKPGENCDWA